MSVCLKQSSLHVFDHGEFSFEGNIPRDTLRTGVERKDRDLERIPEKNEVTEK